METALAVEDGGHHGDNAHQHDDALDKIVDGGGHVAPGDDIHAGEHGHDHDAHGIVDVERHAEQTAQTVVQGCRVGNEKQKDDGRCRQFQSPAVEPVGKELGHGGAVQVLGHDAGSPSQDGPGQQGTQQGVADTGPGGGHAEFPAELTGVAHEDHRRKVAGAVGKGGEPGAHRAAAQDKAADVGSVAAAVQANVDHDGEEHRQHTKFNE